LAERPFVEVSILGRSFRVRAEGGADALRRAASLAEETLDRVRGRSGAVDTADVALRGCLSLAAQLIASRESQSEFDGLDEERIEELISLLESALDSDVAASP